MDCIVSYHMNPLTCGVAKFNHVLASYFGVPMLQAFDPELAGRRHPLFSLKFSEFSAADVERLKALLGTLPPGGSFSIFLHEFLELPLEHELVRKAAIIYCGNLELLARIRALRPDAVEAWAPGMLFEQPRFRKSDLSVFSFGMAHKLSVGNYRKLRNQLEATGMSYCVYLSTALHEGTSFDGNFELAYKALHEIFAGNIYFLGYLSEVAIYNYLFSTTFFAAFFNRGVRANNTSVHAAMECGSVVVTNLDEHSPAPYVHQLNLIDINQAKDLPTDPRILSLISANAKAVARTFGWDRLVERIRSSEQPLSR